MLIIHPCNKLSRIRQHQHYVPTAVADMQLLVRHAAAAASEQRDGRRGALVRVHTHNTGRLLVHLRTCDADYSPHNIVESSAASVFKNYARGQQGFLSKELAATVSLNCGRNHVPHAFQLHVTVSNCTLVTLRVAKYARLWFVADYDELRVSPRTQEGSHARGRCRVQ